MRHILLAIDRSAPSWEASRLAIHLAPKLKAPVTVLSMVVPETPHRGVKDQSGREYETAHELVKDVVKELVGAGVKTKGDVRSCKSKEVAAEILGTAARIDADLIIMGSRARGELTGLLLGSVSHEVAMNAGCPVVIVPTSAMTKVTPRRIVLVIDGEGDPEQPVATTVELAHALDAAVEVVCVSHTLGDLPESGRFPSSANPDEEAVARVATTLQRARVDVRWRMIDNRRGFAPEIAREVTATGADVVVIGARAMGWVGDDVGAGAAEAVVRRTHRPVIVAPARRRS